MISPEQSGDIKKNYCGHKIELFLDNLGNQELDNLRDHKQYLKDAEKQDIETQEIENRNDNKNNVINNDNNKIIMSSLAKTS